MANLRILVAEDSITVRKHLVGVLSAEPGFEVVGEAADGQTAIELCQKLRPDVVTLDMMMPKMSGLAATEHIMAFCPTPILIVSASTNRGELYQTFEALAAGALDVLDKPKGSESDGEWDRKLISSVRMASRIKVITHLRARLSGAAEAAPDALSDLRETAKASHKHLIAIGASTGGPAAILEILRGLSPGLPAPILLVLHIGQPFGSAFAEWLFRQTGIPIAYAEDGEPLPSPGEGRVIMAPPDQHLQVSRGRLRLTSDPERHSCRPSVDVLFETLAREVGAAQIACLLTGMGRDGASGLLAIRKQGGTTIAQDEATSVVFGMPREAILLGAAERVLPLSEIAPSLRALIARSVEHTGAHRTSPREVR